MYTSQNYMFDSGCKDNNLFLIIDVCLVRFDKIIMVSSCKNILTMLFCLYL